MISLITMTGGEQLLGLPAIIKFPFYEDGKQYFPYRTLIMLISLSTHLIVSKVSKDCFTKGWLSPKFDLLNCYDDDSIQKKERPSITNLPQETSNADLDDLQLLERKVVATEG